MNPCAVQSVIRCGTEPGDRTATLTRVSSVPDSSEPPLLSHFTARPRGHWQGMDGLPGSSWIVQVQLGLQVPPEPCVRAPQPQVCHVTHGEMVPLLSLCRFRLVALTSRSELFAPSRWKRRFTRGEFDSINIRTKTMNGHIDLWT